MLVVLVSSHDFRVSKGEYCFVLDSRAATDNWIMYVDSSKDGSRLCGSCNIAKARHYSTIHQIPVEHSVTYNLTGLWLLA